MTWTILSLQNVRLDSPPHPLRLVHLPTDALIAILTKLDPPDILSVRATCTVLAALTREHSVWTGALRRLCNQYAILRSTFPVDHMSPAQIERKALLPDRFEQLLLSGGSHDSGAPPTKLIPSVVRTLHIDPPADPNAPSPSPETGTPASSDVQMMRIIPGGRYLVTGTQLGCVAIWDLEYDSAVAFGRKPLASVFLDGPVNSLHVQSWQADSFLLAMEYKSDVHEVGWEITAKGWKIMKAETQGERLDLSPMAEIAHVQAEGYALMECEYIAVEHAGAIFLWDWMDDTWAVIERYRMNMDPPEFDPRDQYRSTPHINKPYISIYDGNLDVIVIFKIPIDLLQPASPSPTTDDPFKFHPHLHFPPILTLTPHIVVPMPYSAVPIPIRQWQPDLRLPSTPAFMTRTQNPSDEAAAAFVLLHVRRVSAVREMAVPARVAQIRLDAGADLLNAQALYSRGGRGVRVVTVWNAEEGMTTAISEPHPSARPCLASDPLTDEEEAVEGGGARDTRPVILTDRLGPDARDRMAMSFCPLTGRVCMSIRPGEVMIMDYVA